METNDVKTFHQCVVCDEIFQNYSDLVYHNKLHVKDEKNDELHNDVDGVHVPLEGGTTNDVEACHKFHLCGNRFEKYSDLEKHCKTDIKDEVCVEHVSNKCNVCAINFKEFKELEIHRKVHLESSMPVNMQNMPGSNCIASDINLNDNTPHSPISACPNKDKQLPDENGLGALEKTFDYSKDGRKQQILIMNAVGEKSFQCHVCSRLFKQNGHLQMHLRTHSGVEPYKCELCDQSFSKLSQKQAHYLQVHGGVHRFKCDVCSKSFPNKCNVRRHMRIHTGEKPFQCEVCGKSFNQGIDLKRHGALHSGEFSKKYECDVCGKGFYKQRDLCRHENRHRYKCDICDQTFGQQKLQQKHMMIHTAKKCFKCDECSKIFIYKSLLKKHARIHTGEKNFKCDFCRKSFTQKCHLQTHMKIHTDEKQFQCDVCNRQFRERSNLRRHKCMKGHTPTKNSPNMSIS